MKEIEYIKKVEEEVSKEVERAKKEAENRINLASLERDKIIEKALEIAESRTKRIIEKAKTEAEKEGGEIMKDADKQTQEIERVGKKNLSKAVEMILRNFRE
jgi:ATP synthase H subunit